MLFVGTTAFFREPALFQELEVKYLPALAGDGGLKVWSAGCSNGAELYSVALLLDAQGRLPGSRLVGTDCNPEALAQARRGVYTRREVEGVRPDPWKKTGTRSIRGWPKRPTSRSRTS